MSNPLRQLKDSVSMIAHGMTAQQAIESGICVVCKQQPLLNTEASRAEYQISGIGNCCWHEVTRCDS